MSAPPYMRLFWGDYHKATRHLTRDQHGAYLLLIGEAWRLGGSLPDDDRLLAAWALCTPSEWAEIKSVVMAFFDFRRGKWTHDRVREERAHYETISRKRKSAGKRGGSVSHGKNSGNTEANAKQLPTKPEPEPYSKKEPPLSPLQGENTQGDGVPPDEPVASGRRKPKRAIPVGFPTADLIDEQQQAARAAGANLDMGRVAERFRNWAEAKDARYANWSATWRNWAARSIDEAPKARAPIAPTPTADLMEPIWRRRVQSWLTGDRYWNTTDWGSRPGRSGCYCPANILAEFGITEEQAA